MAAFLTKKVITELQAIIKSNSDVSVVTINELKPLASITDDVVIDIALQSVLMEPYKNSSGRDAYNRRFLLNVYCSVDCKSDALKLFDVVDSIERSILNDGLLWDTVVDRDIVTVTYDNAEIAPYRTATMLVEALIRLECDG